MRKLNLLALLVLIPFIVYTPVLGQGVSTQSSSISTTTLQTYSTAKTVTAAANHVVQPFGKYTSTKTGTIYAANGVDNVTITLSSGFPSFSSYVGNSTLQQWASGCQTEKNQEQGANLVISYIGTSCGITPVLKVSFSPLPSYNATKDPCSVYWSHEYYTWCGDSGFTYLSGTLTIVPSSTSFDEDPSIVQQTGNNCTPCSSPITVTFPSSVTKNDLVLVVMSWYAQGATDDSLSGVIDTLSTSYTAQVTAGSISNLACGGTQTYLHSVIYSGTLSNSGSNTVSISYTGSSQFAAFYQVYEIIPGVVSATGSQSAYVTNPSTLTTSSSVSYNGNNLLIGNIINQGTNYPCTPGTIGAPSGFTSDNNPYSYVMIAHNIPSSSGTTNFPFSATGSVTSVAYDETAVVIATDMSAVLVLQVQTTSSGMILMPTINNAATTITSLSTLTATCCTTNTWTVIGVPWGGNIFAAWSGATTWIQNTLDPTQTITYSSFAVSTLTSTLTASFSSATGGGSAPSSPDYTWLLLLPFILLAIVIVLRRR